MCLCKGVWQKGLAPGRLRAKHLFYYIFFCVILLLLLNIYLLFIYYLLFSWQLQWLPHINSLIVLFIFLLFYLIIYYNCMLCCCCCCCVLSSVLLFLLSYCLCVYVVSVSLCFSASLYHQGDTVCWGVLLELFFPSSCLFFLPSKKNCLIYISYK